MNNQKRHIELAIEALKDEKFLRSRILLGKGKEVLEAIEYLESILYIFVEDKEKGDLTTE